MKKNEEINIETGKKKKREIIWTRMKLGKKYERKKKTVYWKRKIKKKSLKWTNIKWKRMTKWERLKNGSQTTKIDEGKMKDKKKNRMKIE